MEHAYYHLKMVHSDSYIQLIDPVNRISMAMVIREMTTHLLIIV